ncbi:hypothetical protein CI109_103297 [Kwoniella shandongensis]|uniref:Uncharacterized protein n=1 Tax=Kwoniella shandongensis TaxID=1734106 RepID=A0A5M6BU32_9TREE|nr:uncharacterized protein CI109_006031 [Kwoniella shandongensis]KAA5525580.1 hypothetical protein CI109_006031 [Kwoniella shandongensis]
MPALDKITTTDSTATDTATSASDAPSSPTTASSEARSPFEEQYMTFPSPESYEVPQTGLSSPSPSESTSRPARTSSSNAVNKLRSVQGCTCTPRRQSSWFPWNGSTAASQTRAQT